MLIALLLFLSRFGLLSTINADVKLCSEFGLSGNNGTASHLLAFIFERSDKLLPEQPVSCTCILRTARRLKTIWFTLLSEDINNEVTCNTEILIVPHKSDKMLEFGCDTGVKVLHNITGGINVTVKVRPNGDRAIQGNSLDKFTLLTTTEPSALFRVQCFAPEWQGFDSLADSSLGTVLYSTNDSSILTMLSNTSVETYSFDDVEEEDEFSRDSDARVDMVIAEFVIGIGLASILIVCPLCFILQRYIPVRSCDKVAKPKPRHRESNIVVQFGTAEQMEQLDIKFTD